MIFLTEDNVEFHAFPLKQYHYKLNIGESCYAIRFITDDKEEYIISTYKNKQKCLNMCKCFSKKLKIQTHFIEVTRISEHEFTYETHSLRNNIPGTQNGKFTQKNVLHHYYNDEYSIGVKYHNNVKPNKCDNNEFSINPSYLSDEYDDIKNNQAFNDEFLINPSYATSDFMKNKTDF